MARQVMTIDGIDYVERKPRPTKRDGDCAGCALLSDPRLCEKALVGLAEKAFGGDCLRRDKIYRQANPEAK